MSDTVFKVIISVFVYNLLINPLYAQLKDNGVYITSTDFFNKNLKMAFNKNEDIKYHHINKTSIVIKAADSNITFYDNDIWGYRQNKVDWRIFDQEFYEVGYIGAICIYTLPGTPVMDIPDWNYFSVDLSSPLYVLSRKNLVTVYHADTAFVNKIKSLPNTSSIFKWNKKKNRYEFIDWLSSGLYTVTVPAEH